MDLYRSTLSYDRNWGSKMAFRVYVTVSVRVVHNTTLLDLLPRQQIEEVLRFTRRVPREYLEELRDPKSQPGSNLIENVRFSVLTNLEKKMKTEPLQYGVLKDHNWYLDIKVVDVDLNRE